LDGSRLFANKARITLGTAHDLKPALANLTAQADSWLSQGPWTVTTKKILPPGGDVHDYASQAPYWWPSNTSDGCPYIQRDGVHNPEVDLYTDHDDRASMIESSYVLSLAWYYTGKTAYAKHAGDILRTWFITPATRMNPNLNHAQIIPCANTGRSIGIIDWSQRYADTLDAVAILATGAPGWNKTDISAFGEWNTEYLNWLETSDFGLEESAATNNHGTFALMQSAAAGLFTGDRSLVIDKVNAVKLRVNSSITANGSQPLELVRTRSWHYSIYSLGAYVNMAAIAKHIGIDMWSYEGDDGQSIQTAIDFLIPAATGAEEWPYPELDFHREEGNELIYAASENKDLKAQAAIDKLFATDAYLWPVRPAVQP